MKNRTLIRVRRLFAACFAFGVAIASFQNCTGAMSKKAVDGQDTTLFPGNFTAQSITPGKPKEVWFNPNIGSVDEVDLFKSPQLWATARNLMTEFKFYANQILSDDIPCLMCGTNLYPNFVSAQAFSKLVSWGKRTAIEVGVVKPQSCTADATAPIAISAINRVLSAGGHVDDLSFDEPYWGGRMGGKKWGCHFTKNESADQVFAYTQTIRQQFPQMGFMEEEPYPVMGVDAHKKWLSKLLLRKTPIRTYVLDIDLRTVTARGANIKDDLAELQSFCRSNGVGFGVIIFGNENSNNQDYYNEAMSLVNIVKLSIGAPDTLDFMSWAGFSFNHPRTVPSNLSDSTPFTHTRLLIDGLAVFN